MYKFQLRQQLVTILKSFFDKVLHSFYIMISFSFDFFIRSASIRSKFWYKDSSRCSELPWISVSSLMHGCNERNRNHFASTITRKRISANSLKQGIRSLHLTAYRPSNGDMANNGFDRLFGIMISYTGTGSLYPIYLAVAEVRFLLKIRCQHRLINLCRRNTELMPDDNRLRIRLVLLSFLFSKL